jgi:outer membrane protein assembly factor BamB
MQTSTVARALQAAAVLLAAALLRPAAADWPCWRGPTGNGVAADSAPLAGAPEDGAKPLWTSETILAERDGGYGSPVVANGRVYVYCCWRTKTPVTYRVLREENLADIGVRRPASLTDDAHAAIEAARAAPDRKAVAADDLDGWMEKWVAANLKPEQRKAPGVVQYATDRLRRGDGAPPVEALEILASILDRRFADEAALDAWAAASGLDPKLWRSLFRPRIPDYERSEEDILFCLDARTGATLWKYAKPSRSTRWSSSTTPCVAGGNVYFLGAQCTAYAVDAGTGAEKWTASIPGPTEAGNGHNSSFAFADGRLYVMAGRLVALDAATGKVLWEKKEASGFSSSPVIWRRGGRTFVIAGESRGRFAFDAATGALAWRADAPGPSTPAIDGDLMAVAHGHGLVAFRLSETGAVKVAETEKGGSKGGSPVAAGNRVYSGSFEAACLDVASGSLLWSAHRGIDHYSSGALAHGKLWILGKNRLAAVDPGTGAEAGRIRADYLKCSSPAFADGKVFLRTRKAVVCYDLAAPAPPGPAAASPGRP